MSDLLLVYIHGLYGDNVAYSKCIEPTILSIGYMSATYSYSSNLTLENVAIDLDSYLESLIRGHSHIKRIILIGHSAGGRISLESRSPLVIGVITLMCPIQGSRLAKESILLSLFTLNFMAMDMARPATRLDLPHFTITCNQYTTGSDGILFSLEMISNQQIGTGDINGLNHGEDQISSPQTLQIVLTAIEALIKHHQDKVIS